MDALLICWGGRPDTDVASQLAIGLFFNADIHKRILAKDAFGVQVCSQESRTPR